jgi:hypothetical protein
MTPFLTTTLGKTTIHYYNDCISNKLSTYEEIHASIRDDNRVGIGCGKMDCSKCILKNIKPDCGALGGYAAIDEEFKNYMINKCPELLI